ncbi:Spc19-domain-containing protein [Cytidiella melzeri]|nr:Spc19-domain-containing protein [Cytidiella melzeri]
MEKNSRLSRVSLHPKYAPRQSVFAGAADFYQGDNAAVCSPFLRECVLAMEDCCDEAHETQEILRQGTYDLPRMTKVLSSKRAFLLSDEGTVRRYKADLTDEIEPQVNELLTRAERGLNTLLKQKSMLQTKVRVDNAQQFRTTTGSKVNTAGMNKLDLRRMQILVRQREHLEKEMNALQAEVDALVSPIR